MHSRGQEEEGAAGDKQPTTAAGVMGAAAQLLGGGGEVADSEEAVTGDKPREAAAGAPLMGMVQRFLGGEEPGAGDKPAGWGAMAGQAAQAFLVHGGEGGAVGGATAEGAGKSDVGLVDKLLGLYAQHQGKPVRRGGWGAELGSRGHERVGGRRRAALPSSLCLLARDSSAPASPPPPSFPLLHLTTPCCRLGFPFLAPQFEGKSEGDYDQLAGLANNVLGTPVGKVR